MKKIEVKKLSLRFYNDESDTKLLKWLDEKAQAGGYTYTTLIKKVLNAAILKKCPKFSKGTEIQKYLYELNKIGNNLNQIAKKVNFNRKLDNEVLDELGKIRAELQQLNNNIKNKKC